LPPAPVALSKRQTIARLAGDIQCARDKGYTLKQIAEHLNRAGLEISYDALRALLPRQKKARGRKPTPRVATGETVRRREVAPLTTAGIRQPSPENPAGSAAGALASIPVPSSAASVPAGDGKFIPAPDSEVL
jgi:hypothetical protein